MQIPIWKVQFKKYLSKTSLLFSKLPPQFFFFYLILLHHLYTAALGSIPELPLKTVGKSTWVKESKPLAANTGITIPGGKKQHSPNVILKTEGNL